MHKNYNKKKYIQKEDRGREFEYLNKTCFIYKSIHFQRFPEADYP